MAKRNAALAPVAENDANWHPQTGDTALVIALARGASVPEAAAEAGVSERTAWRRLADDGFRRCVFEAKAELVNRSLARIADGAARAVDTLLELLDAEDPKARLAAAKMVLEYALPMRDGCQAAADALRPTEQYDPLEEMEFDLMTRRVGPEKALPELFGTGEDTDV
jgi:hypothetical protein